MRESLISLRSYIYMRFVATFALASMPVHYACERNQWAESGGVDLMVRYHQGDIRAEQCKRFWRPRQWAGGRPRGDPERSGHDGLTRRRRLLPARYVHRRA